MKLAMVCFLLLSSQGFGQTITKDGNSVDGRPLQTDKILLKDGSEKKHITKKVKGTPIPTPTPAPAGAGLPTDVD